MIKDCTGKAKCVSSSSSGDVAVKMLNVTAPTPQQLQAFKNEVGVLRWELKITHDFKTGIVAAQIVGFR